MFITEHREGFSFLHICFAFPICSFSLTTAKKIWILKPVLGAKAAGVNSLTPKLNTQEFATELTLNWQKV